MADDDFHVGKAMSFLPPMTGNGKHTTYYKYGDDWGMVYGCFNTCFNHINHHSRDVTTLRIFLIQISYTYDHLLVITSFKWGCTSRIKIHEWGDLVLITGKPLLPVTSWKRSAPPIASSPRTWGQPLQNMRFSHDSMINRGSLWAKWEIGIVESIIYIYIN